MTIHWDANRSIHFIDNSNVNPLTEVPIGTIVRQSSPPPPVVGSQVALQTVARQAVKLRIQSSLHLRARLWRIITLVPNLRVQKRERTTLPAGYSAPKERIERHAAHVS